MWGDGGGDGGRGGNDQGVEESLWYYELWKAGQSLVNERGEEEEAGGGRKGGWRRKEGRLEEGGYGWKEREGKEKREERVREACMWNEWMKREGRKLGERDVRRNKAIK